MRKSNKEAPGQMHFIEVPFKCPMCGKEHSMMLFESDFDRYMQERSEGKPISLIFPDMSLKDREKFITGYCDDCQDLIFGK